VYHRLSFNNDCLEQVRPTAGAPGCVWTYYTRDGRLHLPRSDTPKPLLYTDTDVMFPSRLMPQYCHCPEAQTGQNSTQGTKMNSGILYMNIKATNHRNGQSS
jgi:hypothetical protein